jgi:hypothetical protein
VVYAEKRRLACRLSDASYSRFVEVNLDLCRNECRNDNPVFTVRVLLPVILPALIQQWKTSVVLLIPKVVNPSNFSDFRPLSLQPVFNKVAEILMAKQMNSHIPSNNLLTKYQSDF